MKEILFILLLQVVTPSFEGTFILGPDDVVDKWSTLTQQGDSLVAATMHYKAILFYSKDALNEYLTKQHIAQDAILIDIKKGTQSKIRQKEVLREVITKERVLDHYDWNLEEGKP